MLSFPTIAAVAVGGDRPTVVHPITELLPAVAQAGFTGIGLDWFTLRNAESGGTDATSLAGLAADHGLTWTDLSALGLDPDSGKDDRVSRSMARRCQALSIPVCGLVIALPPSADVYQRVAACAEIFTDSGVRLALEFLPYSGIKTLDQARDVCAHVGIERVGLMIDTLHLMRSGGSMSDIAGLDAAEIACVQVADGPLSAPADLPDESRNTRLLPGAGEFDLTSFGAALTGTGYTGTVSLEVLSADLRTLTPDRMAAAYFAAGHEFVTTQSQDLSQR
ncbi:MAG: inosose isomerase [Pseudonocardiales bacterium]|nr:inosose isomerase [Pseudonocardiales bacterium]